MVTGVACGCCPLVLETDRDGMLKVSFADVDGGVGGIVTSEMFVILELVREL